MILQGACWTSPYFAAVSEQGESVASAVSFSSCIGQWWLKVLQICHQTCRVALAHAKRSVEECWGHLRTTFGRASVVIHPFGGQSSCACGPAARLRKACAHTMHQCNNCSASLGGHLVEVNSDNRSWSRERNDVERDPRMAMTDPTAHHSTVVSQGESLLIVCTLPTTFTWPGKGSRSVKKFPCKCGLVRRMPWQQPTMFWWLSSSESRGGDFRWPSQWGPVPRMEFEWGWMGGSRKWCMIREKERERERYLQPTCKSNGQHKCHQT